MAGNKYLFNNAGVLTEKAGTQTSAGITNANEIPALDSTGHLDVSVMPVGIGLETDSIPCSENLAAGDFVNIYSSSGVKCRKADATTSGKEAGGFVLSVFTTGQTAIVYRPTQSNTQLTGLTAGARQYLSTVAGKTTETAPSSTGNVIQFLGYATSVSSMGFIESMPIVLA